MAMTFFKTTYLCNKVLDYFFGTTSWTPPTTLYFGLFTTAPSQPAGTGGVECSGNSYTRATITNNGGATQWNVAASAQKTNVADITFATPTGTGWGTVVAVGIFDASGNLLWVCILGTSKTVGAGTVVKFKGSTSTGTTGNCVIQEA